MQPNQIAVLREEHLPGCVMMLLCAAFVSQFSDTFARRNLVFEERKSPAVVRFLPVR